MTNEQLIDYTGYLEDPIRVAHETEAISTEALKLDEVQNSSVENLIQEEITNRKRIMSAMHKEIKSLEELL